MLRLKAYISKEFKVLFRDRAGLAIIFLMPIALILIMSLIQDGPFRDYQEVKIPVLVADWDKEYLGKGVIKELYASKIFKVDTLINGQVPDEAEIRRQVSDGHYQLGIIVPQGTSKLLRDKVQQKVNLTLKDFGMLKDSVKEIAVQDIPFKIFVDPATKKSFRTAVFSSIEKFVSDIQLKEFISVFRSSLGVTTPKQEPMDIGQGGAVKFEEFTASTDKLTPDFSTNSVQHNVPAWTLFAMFFIVIPLAGNMINERDLGSELRMRIMPGSPFIAPVGRVITYTIICQLQLWAMLAVGIWVMPFLNLPSLVIGQNYWLIALAGLLAGMAATSYGVMVGSVFKTHQQAMVFGAVSVVILSAIGGIWIPTYVMPESMQLLSKVSPLNWSLEAFNDIFLRGKNTLLCLPWIQTILFVSVCLGLIRWADGRK